MPDLGAGGERGKKIHFRNKGHQVCVGGGDGGTMVLEVKPELSIGDTSAICSMV